MRGPEHGYAIAAHGYNRFSEDLDFTLAEPMELEDILAGLEGIYGDVERDSGIRIQYARADRKSHQNTHTFYLGYEGPLPAVSAKEVKVEYRTRRWRPDAE